VGYGLDWHQRYRNLPYVALLNDEWEGGTAHGTDQRSAGPSSGVGGTLDRALASHRSHVTKGDLGSADSGRGAVALACLPLPMVGGRRHA